MKWYFCDNCNKSSQNLDWCSSGGSRGGARGARASPLIFRPKWGPKGPKKMFLRPGPLPLFQGLADCPPPLIWRSGSTTVFYYNLHSMQRRLCLIAYRGSWLCSWFREFFWILNLPPPPPPNRWVNFTRGIRITEELLSILFIKKLFRASWNDFWASRYKLYNCLSWHPATHVQIHWTDALPVSSQELLTAEQGVIGLILRAGPILGNEDTAFALQMLHLYVAQMTI